MANYFSNFSVYHSCKVSIDTNLVPDLWNNPHAYHNIKIAYQTLMWCKLCEYKYVCNKVQQYQMDFPHTINNFFLELMIQFLIKLTSSVNKIGFTLSVSPWFNKEWTWLIAPIHLWTFVHWKKIHGFRIHL